MLRLEGAGQVHPAVFASALLPGGCRMEGLVCMRNSAVALHLADAAVAQDWSLLCAHGPGVDLFLMQAAIGLGVEEKALVGIAAWPHCASGAIVAVCHA